MRKAFKFYHSYYEIGKELSDKDRLAFYDALLGKQFENIETQLTGMAKFAYISQKHSIEAQVKGYYDQTLDPLFTPMQGGMQGGGVTPSQQEKEQVQEQVKEEVQVKGGKPKKSNSEIPSLNEFMNYYESKLSKDFPNLHFSIETKYETWLDNGWKDGHGKIINNWKLKLKNTITHLKPIFKTNTNGASKQTMDERTAFHGQRIVDEIMAEIDTSINSERTSEPDEWADYKDVTDL